MNKIKQIIDYIEPDPSYCDIDESDWINPEKYEWVDLAVKLGNTKADEIIKKRHGKSE